MVFASLSMLLPWACAVLLIVRLLFYEGNLWRGRASLRRPERQRREIPDGSSGEAPESDFFLITRNRRQREEGGGQSQPEEPGGGQTTRRDSGEVPEKEPRSRLRQRRDRPRRKLRRGPGVGWDWFSNSFPLVFLSEPIREPTK